jgi:hypothetical protein
MEQRRGGVSGAGGRASTGTRSPSEVEVYITSGCVQVPRVDAS